MRYLHSYFFLGVSVISLIMAFFTAYLGYSKTIIIIAFSNVYISLLISIYLTWYNETD